MKKLVTILLAALAVGSLSAQTVLRESTHGILPGYPNPMILTQTDNPGVAGKDVVWDFSALPQMGAFRGETVEPSSKTPEQEFAAANSLLVEDDLEAFLKSSRRQVQVVGMRVQSAKMIRTFNKPYVKMRYPFAYGDRYVSAGKAVESYGGNYAFDVHFDVTLDADGLGTLLLPGTTLHNVLRVLTAQEIRYVRDGKTLSTTNIETYRWYVNSHRYPVLSLIYERNKSGKLVFLKGVYNPIVEVPATLEVANNDATEVNAEANGSVTSLEVRPNPFVSELKVAYTVSERANVIVALYDLQGYLVKTLEQGVKENGTYQKTFANELQGLQEGVYILRVETKGAALDQRVVKL